MLLTLFSLERDVMESKNYFWELIFILMPTRVSRGCLLIEPSFAEKRVWFSQDLPNFLQNMLLTLFYLERHVMESKNYFWELIFILMPTRISRRLFCWLDRLLLQNVYDLAKNFQIFFKNMLLTLFSLERDVMESKKLFLRINLHINAHKGIETMFADWTVFCWKACMI